MAISAGIASPNPAIALYAMTGLRGLRELPEFQQELERIGGLDLDRYAAFMLGLLDVETVEAIWGQAPAAVLPEGRNDLPMDLMTGFMLRVVRRFELSSLAASGGRVRVLCDFCGKDWTDKPVTGGLLFQSKAVCPECAPKLEADIESRYPDEAVFIRARCPEYRSFSAWVIEDIGGGTFVAGPGELTVPPEFTPCGDGCHEADQLEAPMAKKESSHVDG